MNAKRTYSIGMGVFAAESLAVAILVWTGLFVQSLVPMGITGILQGMVILVVGWALVSDRNGVSSYSRQPNVVRGVGYLFLVASPLSLAGGIGLLLSNIV
jgi:hypothetical protein